MTQPPQLTQPLMTRSVTTCPRSHPPAVHLTRRGRILLLGVLVSVLFGAFSLGRAGSQAAPQARPAPALEQMTVQPGESLWTVAERIAPENDPREVIAQIRRLNDLSDSTLRIGQQLLLPVPA
ncbi:MAG: LysM peptidoglycan-binding domain-containing protein [Actinomycetota bacterium]|nr:LysM peptidoglycan-binding domain-containing protein [Actinomycetota bacterium]